MRSERFEMRLDRETLEQVDKWRAALPDVPSRAEAMRRLVNAGLASSDVHTVSLDDGQKLILMMLRDLFKHQKVQGEIDPDFVAETIWGGHHWGLEWQYPGIFGVRVRDPRVVSEVGDILEMWHFIESGYENLSNAERAMMAQDVAPLGKQVAFPGFDGNNESEHFSIARHLVNALDRFTRFQGRDLNSHLPALDAYKQMLRVFQSMRPTLSGGELSGSQIATLLKARQHPTGGRST